MRSVFVSDDGHKRGQASSPDVGAEIQTYCNFEAHISHCSHLLGFLKFRRVAVFFFNYRITLWLLRISILLYLLTSIILYTKIFFTLRRHRAEG